MNSLAPIILFVYNRPKHTRQTLEALSRNSLAQKSELIVFADGIKEDATQEQRDTIHEVRSIVKEQQWCGKVTLIESTVNRGIEESEIDGITTIVNTYGKVIVLEDDIITASSFLSYMNDGLEMYATNQNVYSINGYMFPIDFGNNFDTFLCPLGTSAW